MRQRRSARGQSHAFTFSEDREIARTTPPLPGFHPSDSITDSQQGLRLHRPRHSGGPLCHTAGNGLINSVRTESA